MASDESSSAKPSRRVVLALALLIVAAAVGVIAFVISQSSSSSGASADYAAALAEAMDGADADNGAALINELECFACHVLGDGSLSPLFDGIGNLAAERRPPLTAEQYLYEAIVYPSEFILADYSDSMPNNYAERATPRQIGDMIAYLLTLTDMP